MTESAVANDCPKVKFSTNKGDMLIELFVIKPRLQRKILMQYVKDGFYDGTIFIASFPIS